jgi:tRNA (mo5U34)-methyltransferase
MKNLIEEMKDIQFRHIIEVAPGIFTPGTAKNNIAENCTKRFGIPEKLSNKTVLDIGCWDGIFSFECEKRGAVEVLATDVFSKNSDGCSEGFKFCKKALDSKVKFKKISVYDLSPETVGQYDIVLFYGVLYHLQEVLPALKAIKSITRDYALISSAMAEDEAISNSLTPCFELRPGYLGDSTNCWYPNMEGLKTALLHAGFTKVEIVHVSKNSRRATVKAYV